MSDKKATDRQESGIERAKRISAIESDEELKEFWELGSHFRLLLEE